MIQCKFSHPVKKFKNMTMEFQVLDKSPIREIETMKTASILGIFRVPGGRDKLGSLTLYDSACSRLNELIVGSAYRSQLLTYDRNYNYATKLKTVPVLEQISLPFSPVEDLVRRLRPFTPSMMGKREGPFMAIHARSLGGRVTQSKSGNLTGFLTVCDPMDFSKKLTVIFAGDPLAVTRYGVGSECFYVVDIVTGNEQYGNSIFGQFILPIVSVPADLSLNCVGVDTI